MDQHENKPLVVGPLGTGTFHYDAKNKRIGFTNWQIMNGAPDPADYSDHRAVLNYLLERVDEAEADAKIAFKDVPRTT
jgi:hypothetical protein